MAFGGNRSSDIRKDVEAGFGLLLLAVRRSLSIASIDRCTAMMPAAHCTIWLRPPIVPRGRFQNLRRVVGGECGLIDAYRWIDVVARWLLL